MTGYVLQPCPTPDHLPPAAATSQRTDSTEEEGVNDPRVRVVARNAGRMESALSGALLRQWA